MNRLFFSGHKAIVTLTAALSIFSSQAMADVSAISATDATKGLKETLMKGADVAIQNLGKQGGFLNNEKVHIPLPDALENLRGPMRFLGKDKQFNELEVALNSAAEAAIPEAKNLMQIAIKNLTVQDAKKILSGGSNSITEFFKDKTQKDLQIKLLPIVKRATDKTGLATQYNLLASKGVDMGLIKGDQANVENYVTQKAMAGLFTIIGEQEEAIRANPMQTGSQLLQKIFSM